ncbi:MAG: hypothetical protein OEZ01_06485 [Candidatus Heimdallarchaeota archaeon]|nr:hypothetical protein [Candidatus Heimdallarchaeota archaeon]
MTVSSKEMSHLDHLNSETIAIMNSTLKHQEKWIKTDHFVAYP